MIFNFWLEKNQPKRNSSILLMLFTRKANKLLFQVTVRQEKFQPWKTVCVHVLNGGLLPILHRLISKQGLPSSARKQKQKDWIFRMRSCFTSPIKLIQT